MNSDSAYWLFSAAAQSLAGLIGFLMAGVALAFSIMDRLVDEDDTYREIIRALKRRHYADMAALVVLAGIAVISNLVTVGWNPMEGGIRTGLIIFTTIVDVAVIGAAVYLVISIANPERYRQEAKSELAQVTKSVGGYNVSQPDQSFFTRFIALEKDIRNYLRDRDLYIPSRGSAKMTYSFRQMIDGLYQNEHISSKLRDELMAVNKTRNLLFHGHIDKVDKKLVDNLESTAAAWEKEKKSS